MKIFTKHFLENRAQERGHNKTFIKIMLTELIPYERLKDLNPSCTVVDLSDWLSVHCNKPMSNIDYEQAEEYYNLTEEGDYKMYSDLLYWFIINLLDNVN